MAPGPTAPPADKRPRGKPPPAGEAPPSPAFPRRPAAPLRLQPPGAGRPRPAAGKWECGSRTSPGRGAVGPGLPKESFSCGARGGAQPQPGELLQLAGRGVPGPGAAAGAAASLRPSAEATRRLSPASAGGRELCPAALSYWLAARRARRQVCAWGLRLAESRQGRSMRRKYRAEGQACGRDPSAAWVPGGDRSRQCKGGRGLSTELLPWNSSI